MHALFKAEVEYKMTPTRPDFVLCAFRSSSPASLPGETLNRAACFKVRVGNVCRNPCGSCIFSASHLKREQSPLRCFGQILESYCANSNGICS